MIPLKDRVQQAVDAGFKRGQLAKAAKKSAAAVTHWTTGQTQSLDGESVVGLAELTGWNALWWAEGRGPRASSDRASPPPPPSDFSDRREVSDSDWGLLQDIRMMMSDEELAELRAKAARAKAVMAEQHPELVGAQSKAPSDAPIQGRPTARVVRDSGAPTLPLRKQGTK